MIFSREYANFPINYSFIAPSKKSVGVSDKRTGEEDIWLVNMNEKHSLHLTLKTNAFCLCEDTFPYPENEAQLKEVQRDYHDVVLPSGLLALVQSILYSQLEVNDERE